MIVSELIQTLQKSMKECGDREVIISVDKNINNDMIKINLWEKSFEVYNSRNLDMRNNKIILIVRDGD